ncbi:GNAT family N-acetyltransferase [Dokdonella sp.]|uniref:GNAT family N-acetyltransferase n=1 Tax=Dokdonella sp. TaxID=2291710 RepID=UPI0031BE4033|nr:GNAT family N-acetyltransferase [Dokdonella sp.]
MPSPQLRIETERLLLRPPAHEDFERFADMFSDEDNVRYIGGALPRSEAWRRFLHMPGAWAMQGFAMFSVIDKTSGLWLGQCGPWQPEGWPGTEVGWSFHRDAWGQGFAVEAATAALDWVFAQLGWSEVIHTIQPANRASQAVAGRLGSVLRGACRLPPPHDTLPMEVWGQTRAQWLARRAPGGVA